MTLLISAKVTNLIVLIEYKGKNLADHRDELHKKSVGQLWADRSHGRARFGWIVDRDWHTLEIVLAE